MEMEGKEALKLKVALLVIIILSNVYLDEGLRANLISINQLCDDGLKVVFTSDRC